MNLRIFVLMMFAVACWAAEDPVAARLARDAHEAQQSGQIVRAYLLYAKAAARDPRNPTYRANREALAPAAKLLTQAGIETADISTDVKAAESEPEGTEPPIEAASEAIWRREERLQPLPRIKADSSKHDFDIRADEKSLFEQVSTAYGVRAIWDSQLQSEPDIRFEISQADFRTAMEALTAATHTFVFPISEHLLFFVRDTEAKRTELEPHILLTFQLPNALDQRDLIEAANAVRTVLNLRSIGWDSAARTVLIRDRITRARTARSLLEAILLPKAQLSMELEFITMDSDRSYNYGASFPTAFQLLDFGHIGGFQTVLASIANPTNFLGFGGGATLFGIGLTDATLFAMYSNSSSRHLYDATVVVGDGQTADLHIGDKYPIPQTLYTGFQQSAASIYTPVPQITLEDLGLLLKITPHVNGDGDISLEIEADVKALGTQTFNTVPTISERQFKGSVMMREGQWAVIAGLDESTLTTSKTGVAALAHVPLFNFLFSQSTSDMQTSNTLLVIKPKISRLPMSESISPQYFVGTARGERALL